MVLDLLVVFIVGLLALLAPERGVVGAWSDADGFNFNETTICSPRSGPGTQFEVDKKNSTCDVICQCGVACLANDACVGFNVPGSGGWCLMVAYFERCLLLTGKDGWTFYRRINETPAEIAAKLKTTASYRKGTTTLPPTDWQYHTGCRCLCFHEPTTTTAKTSTTTTTAMTTSTRRRQRRQATQSPPQKSTAQMPPYGLDLPGGGRLLSSCPVEQDPNPPQFLLAQYPEFMPVSANAKTTPRNPSAIPTVYSKKCRCFCNPY